MDRIHLAGEVQSPTTAGISPGHPLGYSASFDLSSRRTLGTSPTPSTALSISPAWCLPPSSARSPVHRSEVDDQPERASRVPWLGASLGGEGLQVFAGTQTRRTRELRNSVLGKADPLSTRNRDPVGKRKGKGRKRGREAAAWPLEGLPGSFWFLALMRPSCVPAHGLREIPRVLM